MEELKKQYLEIMSLFEESANVQPLWEWITENFIPKPQKENKEERKANFIAQVIRVDHPLLDLRIIPRKDIEEFIAYWTESGENQKKMRFEMEKVFDIKRRLNTWMRNKEKFNKHEKRGFLNI